MFSITLCLASTSQEAITTAPRAPQGIIHRSKKGSGSMPMAWNSIAVRAVRTPPPSAIST